MSSRPILIELAIETAARRSYSAARMVNVPTTRPSNKIDRDLLLRIAEISRDTAPETFPEMTASDDFELMHRRQAEEQFQYALCRRTWMRLSPEDRVLIRQRVLEKDAFYRDRVGTPGFEGACRDEVGILIEKARARATIAS